MTMSMSLRTLCAVVSVGLAVPTGSVCGQEMGSSRIELQLAVTVPGGTSTASVGSIASESESVGGFGAITLTHWVRERHAVTFSAGAWGVNLESRVGAGEVMSRTAIIVPLMGGVRYYFSRPDGSGFRPYASWTAGPVFGTESESSVGARIAQRSMTRTAAGTRIGAGFDAPFGRSWTFGLFAGYYLISDFSDPIGSRKNHSSPDFGISFGRAWGGTR